MKPRPTWLLLVVLLPAFSVSQSFLTHQNFTESDEQFFQKELFKRSALLQTLQASDPLKREITNEEAERLVQSKLDELNNPELRGLYSQVSQEDRIRIGIALYLLMGTISNLSSGVSNNPQFGGGLSFFLMYTLAKFIVMPEVYLLSQAFGEKYSGQKQFTRFFQMGLAVTVLYLVQLQTLSLVMGLSPQLQYALSGKYKYDNGDKESVEFGGDYGARRAQFVMGLTAGIMLQNYMIIRLQYGLGLTKLYKIADARMAYWAIILSMPFDMFRK